MFVQSEGQTKYIYCISSNGTITTTTKADKVFNSLRQKRTCTFQYLSLIKLDINKINNITQLSQMKIRTVII